MYVNTEFLGITLLFLEMGMFQSMAFHCKTLNIPWYFDRGRGIMYVSETIWSWKG